MGQNLNEDISLSPDKAEPQGNLCQSDGIK
jgi:hypothetical protein